jgi:hypothetical protein
MYLSEGLSKVISILNFEKTNLSMSIINKILSSHSNNRFSRSLPSAKIGIRCFFSMFSISYMILTNPIAENSKASFMV